jgi:hypothetical protein
MHILFSSLRSNGLYMFRALLAHPQEATHKRHLVYCMRVTCMSVGCTTIEVEFATVHRYMNKTHNKRLFRLAKIREFLSHYKYIFFPMPPYVPYGLRGLPSRLWPKCNRLLRLGRPSGAVTRRNLKPKFY